jgi:hypothetical protein
MLAKIIEITLHNIISICQIQLLLFILMLKGKSGAQTPPGGPVSNF